MEILLLNLKIAGLTLLLSITGCSSDICNQARDVANLAINFVPATTTQAVIPTPTPEPIVVYQQTVVQPTPTPQITIQPTQNNGIIVGAVNQPTNSQTMEIIVKDSDNNIITSTVNVPITNLSYFVNVDYLIDGVSQKSDITMTSSDGQSRTMLGSERGWNQRGVGGPRNDGSVNFLYRLNSTGEKTVTFTAGETTKTITINVQ